MILKVSNRFKKTLKINLHISLMLQYIVNHYIEIVYLNIFLELEENTKIFEVRLFRTNKKLTYGNSVHQYYFHNHYHHHIPTNEVYIYHHNQIVIPNILDKLFNHQFQSQIFRIILNLLQLRSSDESVQSAIRLQRHDNGIQRPPVSHLHSLIPQAS